MELENNYPFPCIIEVAEVTVFHQSIAHSFA